MDGNSIVGVPVKIDVSSGDVDLSKSKLISSPQLNQNSQSVIQIILFDSHNNPIHDRNLELATELKISNQIQEVHLDYENEGIYQSKLIPKTHGKGKLSISTSNNQKIEFDLTVTPKKNFSI